MKKYSDLEILATKTELDPSAFIEWVCKVNGVPNWLKIKVITDEIKTWIKDSLKAHAMTRIFEAVHKIHIQTLIANAAESCENDAPTLLELARLKKFTEEFFNAWSGFDPTPDIIRRQKIQNLYEKLERP